MRTQAGAFFYARVSWPGPVIRGNSRASPDAALERRRRVEAPTVGFDLQTLLAAKFRQGCERRPLGPRPRSAVRLTAHRLSSHDDPINMDTDRFEGLSEFRQIFRVSISTMIKNGHPASSEGAGHRAPVGAPGVIRRGDKWILVESPERLSCLTEHEATSDCFGVPTQTTTFKCLLISPGDVKEERDAVISAIERWSTTIGLTLNATVSVQRWELARPEMGAPPQDIINQQLVDDCDFGIAIFWARLGTPTKEHPSGSAEEVERLLNKGANVLVYFCSRAVPQNLLKDDQYAKLTKLRDDFQQRGLQASFETVAELTSAVTLHVNSLVTALLTKERMGNQPIPSVGSMTAPKPDLRVTVSGAIATQGEGSAVPVLRIGIQNHSTVPVFFSAVMFGMSDGQRFVMFRDGLSNVPIYPERIEPGDEKTVNVTGASLPKDFDKKLISLFVTDKIDRTYFADPEAVKSAFKGLKEWMGTVKNTKRR